MGCLLIRCVLENELQVDEDAPSPGALLSLKIGVEGAIADGFEVLTAYASLRLQTVDACVIALAERFDLREMAAPDRRDFMVVAPRHLPKGQRLGLCCRSEIGGGFGHGG
jgi:hypothetical protein